MSTRSDERAYVAKQISIKTNMAKNRQRSMRISESNRERLQEEKHPHQYEPWPAKDTEITMIHQPTWVLKYARKK